MRTGLSLSLDAISHSIDVMGRSPAAAATPALRASPARVRRAIALPACDSRELICAPSCSAVGANHTVQQPPSETAMPLSGLWPSTQSSPSDSPSCRRGRCGCSPAAPWMAQQSAPTTSGRSINGSSTPRAGRFSAYRRPRDRFDHYPHPVFRWVLDWVLDSLSNLPPRRNPKKNSQWNQWSG